jgi:hypothetical protein
MSEYPGEKDRQSAVVFKKGGKMVFMRKQKQPATSSRKVSVEVPHAKRPSHKEIDSVKLNQMIQERAYFLWEERGKPHGQDSDIWAQAEKDIRTQLK